MKKSLSQVLILSAALLLASCQKPGDSKAPESEASATSQTESVPGTSEAGTSTPTGSTSTPTGSTSTPTGSTSTPAGSTSTPAASSTPAAEITYTPAAADIIKETGKSYLKVTGTLTGVTGDAAKFAFGLQHKANDSLGLPDAKDGEWLVGSATPAAADYKYAPTLGADGAFEVKIDISEIAFEKGNYTMMLGPNGAYEALAVGQANYGEGNAEINSMKLIFRGDQNLLVAEELPPVHLTEELVEIDNDNNKAYLKVGGELTTSEAAFTALTPKVTFEKQVGGWSQTVKQGADVTTVVEGTKGYIKVDMTDLGEGGYQVKIGFDGAAAPNTTMEGESYDARSKATAINPGQALGTKGFYPYFQAGGNNASTLYGCCGLFVQHAHAITVGEKEAESDLRPMTCSDNDLTGYELQLDSTNTPGLGSDYKMNSGKIATWNVTGITEGEYEVYFKCAVSSGNGGASKTVGPSTGEQLDDNGSAAGGNAVPGRYYVQADANDKAYMDTGDKNFYYCGIKESTRTWDSIALVSSVMISGATTTLKLGHTNAGYSLYIEAIRLVKIGNYVKPVTPLVFTEGAMKIEAEDAHILVNNKSGTITEEAEGDDFSGDKIVSGLSYQAGGWNSSAVAGQIDYQLRVSEARAIKVKAYAKSNKTAAEKAFEVYLDGVKVSDMAVANAWAAVESVAFNIATGDHTISLKGINNATVDLDYIEILDQGAPLHEHTWVAGTASQNTSGKDVIPLECSGCHKKGAKIAVTDFEGDADTNIDTNNSDGSFKPKKVDIGYKFIVPENGYYTISLGMLISSNTSTAMSSRSFSVKVGETSVPLTLDGTATPTSLGIATSGDPTDVVLAGAQLTAGEVTISIKNPDYRVAFKGYVTIMQAEAPGE